MIIRIFITTILVFFFETSLHADKNKNQFEPKSIANLSFTECEKLKTLLNEQFSPVQKQQIVEAFSEILKLETNQSLPLNLSGSGLGSNTQGSISSTLSQTSLVSQSGDLSVILDPNTENNAKSCIIDNYKKLLPESIFLVPSMVLTLSKESLPKALRGKIINALRDITLTKIDNVNEFVLTNLIQSINDLPEAFESEFVIAPLSKLLSLNLEKILINVNLLSQKAIRNITLSALSNSQDGISILNLVGNTELIFKNRKLRLELLSSLKYFPEIINEILLKLPDLVSSSSGDELRVIIDLLNSFSKDEIAYLKQEVLGTSKEKIIKTSISLLLQSNHTNLDNVVPLLSELKLPNNSELCEISNNGLLELESDKSQYAKFVILASVCPTTKKTNTYYLNRLNDTSFFSKVISILHLSKDFKNHEQIINNLAKSTKIISPKELKQLNFLFLDRNWNSKNPELINMAEKLILEEPTFPLYTRALSNQNPSISYFSNLGKQSIQTIKKLLSDQSNSYHLSAALKITANPEFPFYKELEQPIINVLDSKDLEARRGAYTTLNRSKPPFNKLIEASKAGSDTKKFYINRVLLGLTEEDSEQSIQKYVSAAAISSLKLSCQERTSPITKIEELKKLGQESEIFISFISSEIDCLLENSQIRKRTLDTLSKISPLSESLGFKLLEIIKSSEATKFPIQDYLRIGDIILSSTNTKSKKIEFLSNILKLKIPFDRETQLALAKWLIKKSIINNDIDYLPEELLTGRIYDLSREIVESRKLKLENNIEEINNLIEKIISNLRDLEIEEMSLLNYMDLDIFSRVIIRSKEIGSNKYSYLKMYYCSSHKEVECEFLSNSLIDTLIKDPKLRHAELSIIYDNLESQNTELKNTELKNTELKNTELKNTELKRSQFIKAAENRLIAIIFSDELFNQELQKYQSLLAYVTLSPVEKNLFELSLRIARSH